MSVAPRPPRMAAPEWILLLILSVLWGGSFFFYKVLGQTLPPFTIVFGRVAIAALVLHLLRALRGRPMPCDLGQWGAFAAMGLLNNVVPFSLIVYGETRVPSGLAAILNATLPMFTMLVAHVCTSSEKLDADKTAGIALGLFGVAALVGPDALGGLGSADLVGEAACLLAAIAYAFAGVYGRRFRGQDPLDVATGQLTASSVLVLPLVLLIDRPWRLPWPGLPAAAAMLGLGVPSTALAYLIFFRILARAGATNVSLVTLLIPVSAVLLGAGLLHETLAPRTFAGMGLIGLGLGVLDGRARRWIMGRAGMA